MNLQQYLLSGLSIQKNNIFNMMSMRKHIYWLYYCHIIFI
jgi:hypothetical protein